MLTWNTHHQEGTDLDEMWLSFMNNIKLLADSHIPKSKPHQISRPIYMTAKAREKVKTKNKTFHTWRRTRDGNDYRIYTKARNQAKWECRKAEREFEKKLAKECKDNPKAFYRYAKSKMKTRSEIAHLTREDGSLTATDKDKAEVLNKFFSSIFTREDTVNMPNTPDTKTDVILEDTDLTIDEVDKKLSRLNPNKSAGPDGASPRILKELHTAIAEPLYNIFRKSIDQGKLPRGWKIGHVSPIFKKGDRHQAKNYRPVSLTSVVCKIMESIIRDKIMYHLVQNHLLTKYQHGFVKGRSCVTQILAVLDKWAEALDHGSKIDSVYLDFAKAFDSVPHKRLLMKMKSFGITGKLWTWIEDFLQARIQHVVINGVKSLAALVLSGIPQGSVLGPLLLICFINDMPEVIQAFIQMFADDTKLYMEVNGPEDQQALQKDLTALEDWANLWQLRFNAQKCKVMHLGTSNANLSYHMHQDGEEVKLQVT